MPPRRSLLMTLALGSSGALANWPVNPDTNVAIGDLSGEQAVVKIAPSPDGGAWMGWFDNSTGAYQVRVQKVDFLGNEVFAHNGIVVSANPQSTSLEDWDLRADSAGGCVLAFNDTRTGPDRDVYAYRLSPAGATLWGADGITISSNTNGDTGARIVQLSTGDFAVVHARLVQAGGETPGLIYNRISPGGSVLVSGLTIAGDGVEQPAFHDVIASDNGSFIVVWARDTRTFPSPRHVRGQKYDAGGAPLWNAGSPVLLSGSMSVPIAHAPRIISDGSGGALFTWHTTALQAFAQRVDSAGTSLWPGTGSGAQVAVDGANLSMDPAITYSPNAERAMVFFRKTNSGQTLSGLSYQVLGPTGARLSGDPGAALVALGQGAVAAPRAGRIGEIESVVVYSTTIFGGTDTTVFATSVNTQTIHGWGPVRLSPGNGARFRLGLAMAANGVGRVVWEGDTRNIASTPDVYAQNINPNGTLGACPGDGNFSQNTNFADLNLVLGQFGQAGLFLAGDVNGDELVNFGDLNIVLGGFGSVCPFVGD